MYVCIVCNTLSLSLSESVLLLKCTLVLNRYEYDDDIFDVSSSAASRSLEASLGRICKESFVYEIQ